MTAPVSSLDSGLPGTSKAWAGLLRARVVEETRLETEGRSPSDLLLRVRIDGARPVGPVHLVGTAAGIGHGRWVSEDGAAPEESTLLAARTAMR
ncbi:MAG: hypothetical protein ACRECR_01315, partial [Thermoplasmata archaeon]